MFTGVFLLTIGIAEYYGVVPQTASRLTITCPMDHDRAEMTSTKSATGTPVLRKNQLIATGARCRNAPPARRRMRDLCDIRIRPASAQNPPPVVDTRQEKHPGKNPGCGNEVHHSSVARRLFLFLLPFFLFRRLRFRRLLRRSRCWLRRCRRRGMLRRALGRWRRWRTRNRRIPVGLGAIIRLCRGWRSSGVRRTWRIDGLRWRRPIRLRTIRSGLRTAGWRSWRGTIVRLRRRRHAVRRRLIRRRRRTIGGRACRRPVIWLRWYWSIGLSCRTSIRSGLIFRTVRRLVHRMADSRRCRSSQGRLPYHRLSRRGVCRTQALHFASRQWLSGVRGQRLLLLHKRHGRRGRRPLSHHLSTGHGRGRSRYVTGA
jgi:hypothetical protein